MSEKTLLEVEGLKKYFQVGKGQTLKAVDDISFQIKKGQTLGLVGESAVERLRWEEPCCVFMSRTQGKSFLTARISAGSAKKRPRS